MQKNVSPKVRLRLGAVSQAVLATVAVVGVISLVAVFPGLAYVMGPFIKKKRKFQKKSVDASIDSLIHNGLLKRRMDDKGNVSLELTMKGRWESGIRNFTFSNSETNQWDRKWRIVIFDVPEHKRAMRRELRRAVSLYGFVKLQQSVWVFPYQCDAFVQLVRSHLGIKGEVLSIVAESIENDRWLRNEFNLNT